MSPSSSTPPTSSTHSYPDFNHAFLTILRSALMSTIAQSTHVATFSLVGALIVP